jgi:hypothetical protein
MVGLPLFGGVDSETGVEIKRSAFAVGFSKEKCLRAWAKVGAATPDGVTCACLKDRQVLCAVGDDAETGESFRNIQAANDHAVHALSLAGFDAQFLQVTYVPKKDVEERATITNPQHTGAAAGIGKHQGTWRGVSCHEGWQKYNKQ